MHQLNIIKIITKGYKRSIVKNIKVLFGERKKKQQFGCELYENLPEDEKQRKVEYRKKYYKIWRNKNTSQIKSFNFIVQTQEIAFSDKYRKI